MYPSFPSFRRQPPDVPRHRLFTLPFSVPGFPRPGPRVWVSPVGRRLTATSGRIAFVIILRTDGSPRVALDSASRRRRYLQLQAGERLPGGDSHPSVQIHFQTHCHGSVSRANDQGPPFLNPGSPTLTPQLRPFHRPQLTLFFPPYPTPFSREIGHRVSPAQGGAR